MASRADEALRDLIRSEIQAQLGDLGSLFTVGQPAPAALATPSGFGLVKTQSSEANPVVLNAASYYRTAVAETANNTGAFVDLFDIAVLAGTFYMIRAELWVTNTGLVNGGILFQFTGAFVGGAWDAFAVEGTNAAGTGFVPFQNKAPGTPLGPVCVFDTSGGGLTRARVVAFLQSSATGIIKLQFKNAVGGQNWIVKQGSHLLSTQI